MLKMGRKMTAAPCEVHGLMRHDQNMQCVHSLFFFFFFFFKRRNLGSSLSEMKQRGPLGEMRQMSTGPAPNRAATSP